MFTSELILTLNFFKTDKHGQAQKLQLEPKKMSFAKRQVNNFTLKNVHKFIFFWVSRGFAKPKSTKINAILSLKLDKI